VRRAIPDDPAAAQRKYEIAMRKAKEVVDEAMAQGIREREGKLKEQKKVEVMYFILVDGMSVFEMRARYLRARRSE
jgi:hypothetical protein